MKCIKHIKVIIIIIHDYCTFNITVRKQVQIRAAVCFGHKYMAKICAFSETSTWTTIWKFISSTSKFLWFDWSKKNTNQKSTQILPLNLCHTKKKTVKKNSHWGGKIEIHSVYLVNYIVCVFVFEKGVLACL